MIFCCELCWRYKTYRSFIYGWIALKQLVRKKKRICEHRSIQSKRSEETEKQSSHTGKFYVQPIYQNANERLGQVYLPLLKILASREVLDWAFCWMALAFS